MTAVRLFFDFLSPYSCLALLRAEDFERAHDVRFDLKPVSLGTLLAHHEIKGAGEVPAKRAYAAADVQRVAERDGVPFPGPPRHPFASYDALRVALLFADSERRLALCRELARRCWCAGESLEDRAVLAAAIEAVGLDATDLDARLLDRGVKRALRANADEALALGVFGVPTFVLGERELLWGQDRMELLAERVRGAVGSPLARADELLARGREGAEGPISA